MKKNKYANLALPQAQLDFHGKGILNKVEIIQLLESFIGGCVEEGHKKVMVITGKGVHSKEGKSIIRPIAMDFLESHNNVKNLQRGKINEGAEGVIVVTLQ